MVNEISLKRFIANKKGLFVHDGCPRNEFICVHAYIFHGQQINIAQQVLYSVYLNSQHFAVNNILISCFLVNLFANYVFLQHFFLHSYNWLCPRKS